MSFFIILRSLFTSGVSSIFIQFGDNRVTNTFDFFKMVIILLLFSIRVSIQPSDLFLDSLLYSFLFFIRQLLAQLLRIFHSVLHTVNIRIQWVSAVDSLFGHFVLFSEFFSILQHLLDFLFRESTFFISNDNLFTFASSLISSTHLQNTIGINLKTDFNLRSASRSRGYFLEIELA